MKQDECSHYPIYMHVNYLEHVFPIEEIIPRCAATGYDGIELRGWDITEQRQTADYLTYVHGLTEKHRLKVTFGCRNNTVDPGAAVRRAAMADLKTIIGFAGAKEIPALNVFGGSVMNPSLRFTDFDGNGSAYATEEQWQMTIEYFQEAGDFAAEKGVDLCFETHNCYIHDLAEPTARLLNEIDRPRVKANLDFGNIYINRLNQGMTDEVSLLSGRIGYTHLKNLVSLLPTFDMPVFRSTGLEEGDINNFQLVLEIMKTGYDGIWTIENTMSGDKRNYMHRDLAYLKGIMADARAVLGQS